MASIAQSGHTDTTTGTAGTAGTTVDTTVTIIRTTTVITTTPTRGTRARARVTSLAPRRFACEAEFAQWLNATYSVWGGNPDEVERNPWVTVGDLVGDFDTIALFTEEPHDLQDVIDLTRYFIEGPFAGEYYSAYTVIFPGLFGHLSFIEIDSTKSRRDDIGDVLPELWQMLRDGTPVRKTDRAGVGTRGTRKSEGLKGNFWVAFR